MNSNIKPNDVRNNSINELFELNNKSNTDLSSVEIDQNMKYLFICGCSMSGVGKGTTISAIGKLLAEQGNIITAIKIDPYLNIDAGTMAPAEHGEVFVLEDGGEVDLDLGNYERALNASLNKHHNITSGKIFLSILTDEREGKYLGKTIQMVPHVTGRIKEKIEQTASAYRTKQGKKANICLIEIGGTVGDLESSIFFEAIRQFISDKGPSNCAIIVLSYVPMIGKVKEPKTKPTQHGVKDLKSLGLFPNFLICRSDSALEKPTLEKIAFFSNLKLEDIGNCYNVNNLYDIPLILNQQGIDKQILQYFKLDYTKSKLSHLVSLSSAYTKIQESNKKQVNILLIGKYCRNHDAYYSVIKSIENAGIMCGSKINLKQIEATHFDLLKKIDDSILSDEFLNEENDSIVNTNSTDNTDIKEITDYDVLMSSVSSTTKPNRKLIQRMYLEIINADGVIFPGGFGERGFQSLINLCSIVRQKKIPFLGICLGMQLAVIEFCRNVLKIEDANSLEFVKDTKDFTSDVITVMNDTNYETLGGTLRLGLKKAYISENSLTESIYGDKIAQERHRHRYEVNNKFVDRLEKEGFMFTGKNDTLDRMDMCELKKDLHPFFWATQAHPEFKTKPFYPSLPFYAFIMHASKQEKKFNEYVEAKKKLRNELKSKVNEQSDINKDCCMEELFDFDRDYFWNILDEISKGNY